MRTLVALCFALLGSGVLAQPTPSPLLDSVGIYAGRYHDTEPAGFLTGRTQFVDQYMVAVTGSKTVWRADDWPLALEVDAMLGYQSGLASQWEVAVAPALRWDLFPHSTGARTALRLAPLGVSYTSQVSPLERGPDGRGSQWLNWLFIEVAVAPSRSASSEYFARLHHRCAVYDLLNNYGANGEDFFTLGWRHRF